MCSNRDLYSKTVMDTSLPVTLDFTLDALGGFVPDVAILANGDFPTHPIPLEVLETVPRIVLCDGSAVHLPKLPPSKVECIIGDGDSLPAEVRNNTTIPIMQVADQETNDLTKAVCYCMSRQWHQIAILGATGRREDHTIANFALLGLYLKKGARVLMVTDQGICVPFSGRCLLRLPVGLQLSFFSLDQQPMSATGVRYPFSERVFDSWWEATLNEVTSPQVHLHTSGTALVYLSREHK